MLYQKAACLESMFRNTPISPALKGCHCNKFFNLHTKLYLHQVHAFTEDKVSNLIHWGGYKYAFERFAVSKHYIPKLLKTFIESNIIKICAVLECHCFDVIDSRGQTDLSDVQFLMHISQ
jgi:hypothetical protein